MGSNDSFTQSSHAADVTTVTATGVLSTTDSGPEDPELERGSAVSRYMVLEKAGAGGMGTVYAAYDPDLDRRIAIKLLKRSYLDRDGTTRVLREAQAMAKLSHPNVVSVYDVGTHDDNVFIAMELIEGCTLRQWLKQRERSLEEIVGVFRQVGRGLAAAHAVELVHRDIKTTNILVANDGRACVMDFGLARPAERRTTDDAPRVLPQRVSRKAHSVGACEQDGSATDMIPTERAHHTEELSVAPAPAVASRAGPPRLPSDSELSGEVSTALHATLTVDGHVVGTPRYMAPEQKVHGVFDTRTDQYSFCVTLYEALYGKPLPIDRNIPRAMARAGTVPGWIRRIVLRGLQADPDDRYPSMTALLTDLHRDPRAARRRALIAGSTVALVASAAIGLWYAAANRPPLCHGAERELVGVWDNATQEAVGAAFTASGSHHAKETYGRVSTLLDQRAEAWTSMYTETCQATRVHGRQSAELMDLRFQCLSRRRSELAALTSLFASGVDSDTADHAVNAVFELPPLAQCADTEGLRAAYPPPTDDNRRTQVADSRAQLAEITALQSAGRIPEARARADTLVPEIETLEYPPLTASALTVLGDLQTDAGQLTEAEATLYQAATAAGAAHDQRLLAEIGGMLVHLVGVQLARHAEGIAIGHVTEAQVAAAGNSESLHANLLNALGGIAWSQANFPLAQQHYTRVLELRLQTQQPEAPIVAMAMYNLGLVHYSQGHYDAALELYVRALAAQTSSLGPAHPQLADTLNNIALVLYAQGDRSGARDRWEHSIELIENSLGPEHPKLANALTNLGTLLADDGKCALGLTHLQRALALLEPAVGANHPNLAYPLTAIGICHIELGQPAYALQPLERALALRDSGDANNLADTQFALARAVWDSSTDHKRALALARAARATLAGAGEHKRDKLAEVDTWLATR